MARSTSIFSGGTIFKTGIFAALAAIAFWFFNQKKPDTATPPILPPATNSVPATQSDDSESGSTIDPAILPGPTGGALVRHRWYALSYNEAHEQADWVTYEITRSRLNDNWAARPNTFRPDPEIPTESATPRDYQGSGYDKGHLCAAADMAFDANAIDETFLMSNMSPQVPAFNAGIWRELEELTRDWARKYTQVYVTTGPVLSRPGITTIGFSKVTVPVAFYKVIYAKEAGKAIGFIVPNALSDRPVMEYAFDVDYVEKLTGLDFFPQLLQGSDSVIEASLDKSAWPVNSARYEKRVKEWN
jgi:endonuclease G, mitochondrial